MPLILHSEGQFGNNIAAEDLMTLCEDAGVNRSHPLYWHEANTQVEILQAFLYYYTASVVGMSPRFKKKEWRHPGMAAFMRQVPLGRLVLESSGQSGLKTVADSLGREKNTTGRAVEKETLETAKRFFYGNRKP